MKKFLKIPSKVNGSPSFTEILISTDNIPNALVESNDARLNKGSSDFITSTENSATVNLSVAAQKLKAEFVSLNVSQFTNDAGYSTGGVPASTTLQIGGTSQDLSANRTWIWTPTKTEIESGDTAIIPDKHQQLIFGDLVNDGILVNDGVLIFL